MALPVIILLLICYGYALIILLFTLETDQDAVLAGDIPEFPQGVSIVVPCRNEEAHLSGLLEDLLGQSYPEEHMECIFVNDHSEDSTSSILEATSHKHRHFSYLDLPSGLMGKKKALAHGIAHARHERIIQVDADCHVGSHFVAAHMDFLRQHPSDLVAGFVCTRKEQGHFLEIFDRLDILALMGSGAGSFNLGRPMMCSGANLSYSRELYRETRSFDPDDTVASGDDMFLMIGARKLGRSLSFITVKESIVQTVPQREVRALLAQRIRWSSKAGKLKMPDIQLLGLLVSLTNISILLMPLWFFLFTAWWPWLTGAWIFKILADFFLLFKMTGICNTRSDMRWFLPVSLLYYPYYLLIVFGAILGRPPWKGRSR